MAKSRIVKANQKIADAVGVEEARERLNREQKEREENKMNRKAGIR